MEFPVGELRSLPDNASYHRRNGQASVDVRIRNDTVYIVATCDSLQRLVKYYERMYRNASVKAEAYREAVRTAYTYDSKKAAEPFLIFLILAVAALLIAGVVIVIIKSKN